MCAYMMAKFRERARLKPSGLQREGGDSNVNQSKFGTRTGCEYKETSGRRGGWLAVEDGKSQETAQGLGSVEPNDIMVWGRLALESTI